MGNGFDNVGRAWATGRELESHLKGLDLSWVKGVTIHHMSRPTLQMRPDGLTREHIENIQFGYVHENGWSSGPHLFIDDHRASGMCPFTRPGVHAAGMNLTHVGFELLGDYDSREEYDSARGVAVRKKAVEFVASFLRVSGLPVSSVNGHRDSGQTDKTCPGKHFDLDVFRLAVQFRLNGGDDPPTAPTKPPTPPSTLLARIGNIQWQLDRMKELLQPTG